MTLYDHIGVAVAFSPRMNALLGEAAHLADVFSSSLTLIHVGAYTPDKEKNLHRALAETGLPPDTRFLWLTGSSSATAILEAIGEHQIDLLLAGALEKERSLRYYLGSVAHNLVREAPCSLMLFTEPRVQPEPVRRIVFVTDFSETALVALTKVVRFAELENAEGIDVLRVIPQYGNTMAVEGVRRERAGIPQAANFSEEKALLVDLIDAVGQTKVPIQPHCIEGHGGYVASQFVRDQQVNLLVMPSANRDSHFFQRLFPSDMEWVLREIPCTLWVVRENLG